MRYLPHTESEIQAMLQTVGLNSLDELYASIPNEARLHQSLELPKALSEPELVAHLQTLQSKNAASKMVSFLGAGAYHHHLPPAADQLLLRSEFYTAYTPYQAEVAQGTLQVIFEFQTMVSEILGLPVANASMYDGASAAAEAVLMARRLTARNHTLVCEGLHPDYAQTISTYVQALAGGPQSIESVALLSTGECDVSALSKKIDASTACVVVSYPNFFGCVTDLRKLAEVCHQQGALLITVTWEPFALALIESPGAIGADIAVAEGQPLGLPPQYGGPNIGLFACRNDRKYLQQIPGRLVGKTVDKHGNDAYVLTLSTREQHIRRERATSNICTNSGLCATALTIRMSMLGKIGFVETAKQCLAKAEYLKQRILSLQGYSLVYPSPTLNEFAIRVRGGSASALIQSLAKKNILAGYDLGNVHASRADQLLIAVTERHQKADLDAFVDALSSYHLC